MRGDWVPSKYMRREDTPPPSPEPEPARPQTPPKLPDPEEEELVLPPPAIEPPKKQTNMEEKDKAVLQLISTYNNRLEELKAQVKRLDKIQEDTVAKEQEKLRKEMEKVTKAKEKAEQKKAKMDATAAKKAEKKIACKKK